MSSFCPDNITLSDIWINHGISHCFLDTVSSSIIAGFIFLFGSAQLFIYRRHATRIDEIRLRPSFLYKFQIFLLLLLAILNVTRLYIHFKFYAGIQIYGFMILYTALMFFAYLYAICIVVKERNYQLPSVPSRGHGFVLLLFFTLVAIVQNISLINVNSSDWWFEMKDRKERIEMGFFITRYICTLFVFVLGLRAPGLTSILSEDEARLINENENLNIGQGSTFRNAWKKLKTLMPFLWPKGSFQLQLQVIFCILLMLTGRFVNIYVPLYNKKIVDALTMQKFDFGMILIYVGIKFLQGGGTGTMGLLNNLRSFLWIKIQQYTSRTIEVELFRHLHGLSLRWHLGRKTGEVLRVMDRGTDSINNLLSYIVFQIFPTIADIFIAVIFFITAFNWKFGVLVFITMIFYIVTTIAVTEWRTKYQRSMNLADNATRAKSVDSLLNFETVKYYGAEDYEVDSYHKAILKYQEEEFKSVSTLNILNTVQNIIICTGLLIGTLLCAWLVVHGEGSEKLTVGDYVLFATYIIQLYVPLNWLGTYYRQIQRNFVDMENMFELMKEEQEIIDAPGSPELSVVRGGIDFSNVSFGYSPEKIILRNVTFNIAPGKMVALVGPSGAGKSTIMRLLFRFYDVNSGAIMIDGQNIKTVTQKSLRKAIGVVPQDTVLFNETIKYNIRYARINADDADVIAAARNADIHEKILSMPQQYDTQVGERGLRLSGGEKQRVAIARTILKGPQIVLLDEATSALDTQTERNIQSALSRVCANKTTLVIAHRLSTIIHADEILVLKDGEVVERGRHESLLEDGGLYADMWNQQLKNIEGEKSRNEKDKQETDSQE